VLSGPPGEYVRKDEIGTPEFEVPYIKLKGIGGGTHKGWALRFNWIQRRESYQGRRQDEGQSEGLTRQAERCCMAIVISLVQKIYKTLYIPEKNNKI